MSSKLCQVCALLILDNDGQRIACRYLQTSDFCDFLSQQKFEAHVVAKSLKVTGRQEVEIVMVEEYVVVLRSHPDVTIYLVGAPDENEVLLLEVMNALHAALSIITNNSISKRSLLENLDSTFLLLDELTDGGVILETNPQILVNRISMMDSSAPVDTQLSFNQALQAARRQLLSGVKS
eukprot:GHVL01014641.1.p1 GENE.GHVL01014641.1~~GHVL01014641.1.p1  ORF type:complete len:179 (+),score=31.99 GHVL01014641.1:18-554(+)